MDQTGKVVQTFDNTGMEGKSMKEESENLVRPQPLPFSNMYNFPSFNFMQNQLAMHLQQLYQNSSLVVPPLAPAINPYYPINFNQNIPTLPSAFKATTSSEASTEANQQHQPHTTDDGDSGNETASTPLSVSPPASLPSR